ncbi:MAG TPA: M20 family metallo-hydrolase [Candidatus Aminicenantes bacterium]|nr:MAG: Succinyl-diaminopimelate desuccinylase [Candidatus Aminicenantes bacterium ADurb.Bin147]HNT32129.1 M20 family metallo-hydrolase [Candidatus Aminicenantes bacterium]HOF81981.1 M20 family metallo-hydrolase [Candidatus Aminicenantes bacterium]HOS10500.1 M20 family metallo-hydrolase [Candidatus Aminicenantes bacterium]HOY98013.1 M20 family metallo-hydrolase [Candidatus Aminicenantes bacterium]
MSFDKIAARLDLFRDEMIDLQIKLASIPAISPASGGEGEARKADFLIAYLRESGITDIQVIRAPDLDAPAGYRPNIVARYPGRNSARTVWIMTHLDVVPPGEISLWQGDPFKPWVSSGRIYGRGVEDNQQGLVASIFALKAFHDLGLAPASNVGLAIVADEETGSSKGIPHVLKNSDAFRKGDLIIVPDAGSPDGTEIEVAEKSVLWLKIKILGRQTHGSTPERGINAFKAGAYLAVKLDRLYAAFPEKNPLFVPPVSTFEPTKKDANVPNINTIPGEDVFYMDCRILPHYRLEDVEGRVQAACRSIEKKFGVTITTESMQRAKAAPPTPPGSAVVEALKRAIQAVYQKESRPIGIGGGTVAAYFRREGFEAACWSKIDDTAHQPNEYCLIDNMVGDAKVFAHIMMQE